MSPEIEIPMQDAQFQDMLAFERGELSEEAVVALFQQLIDNGDAWRLQGFYGRIASDLIASGLCQPAGSMPKNATNSGRNRRGA